MSEVFPSDSSLPTLRFKALIQIHGINPYVLVSAKRAAELKPGWCKPMPVLVRINGKPDDAWPINMMPVGNGSFRLYLQGEVRKASRTKVGDRVEVEVQFNAKYKGGPQPLPAWFKSALAKDPVAKGNWDALTPSRRKEVVRYLAALKSAEARERNLARALTALSGEPTRFMARSWSGGR